MQFISYPNGGFCIHKITLPGLPGRVSAWFDQSGKLIDHEYIDRKNRSRSLPGRSAMIEAIGRTVKPPVTVIA